MQVATRDVGHLLGLNEVKVIDLPAPVCVACGAVVIPGTLLDMASLAIAGDMLTQSKLEPIEVRFLRKLLGYTQEELASHLGVDRITANRWEQSANRLSGAQCYALRSHVFVRLRKKAGPLFDRAEASLRDLPSPRPEIPPYSTLHASSLVAA